MKMNMKRLPRCWDIKLTYKEIVGANVCEFFLFAHTLLGCDTTSRVFGIGKGVSLKHLRTSAHFITQTEVFNTTEATKEDIVIAGENALVRMYGEKQGGFPVHACALVQGF